MPHHRRPVPRDPPPWPALALAAAACAVYAGSELYLFSGRLGLPLDDGWIHLHFARQVASGAGLSYNPGAWSTGSTAPLWTALLSLAWPLGLAPVAWAKLLGTALFLVAVDAGFRLARALGLGRGAATLAAALVASTHWLVWSALSGMEVLLFTALGLWGMTLHLRERAAPSAPPRSLPVLGLAALARPEGFLLLGLAVADRTLVFAREPLRLSLRPPGRRLWLEGLLPAAILVLPTLLFYAAASGSPVPSTFTAKVGAPGDLLPDGRTLRATADVLLRSQPLAALLAGAGVLALAGRLGRDRRGLLPALWALALPLAYAFLAPAGGPVPVGNFGRYLFPLVPVVAVLGVLGLDACGRRLGSRLLFGGRALPLGALAAAILLLPQLAGLASGPLRYLQTVANVEDSDVAAARWLASRLPPGALVAAQDAGAVRYFLAENPVLDLAGIVNPEIVPVLRGGDGRPAGGTYWEERLLAYLGEKRPQVLVVFPASYPMITSRVPGFERLQTFQVRDNVTMAGDELAIFSTPWTRPGLVAAGGS